MTANIVCNFQHLRDGICGAGSCSTIVDAWKVVQIIAYIGNLVRRRTVCGSNGLQLLQLVRNALIQLRYIDAKKGVPS